MYTTLKEFSRDGKISRTRFTNVFVWGRDQTWQILTRSDDGEIKVFPLRFWNERKAASFVESKFARLTFAV